jgi:hypothetical protein
VPAPLRLAQREKAIEQLEPFSFEHAELDQALVFEARPAPRLRRRLDLGGHCLKA